MWNWLLLGLVLGVAFAALVKAQDEHRIAALGLIVAAAIYVGFAVIGAASGDWLMLESAGVVLFGGFAWLGSRLSCWWLVIGWAAHPLWDVGLHLLGGGRDFAPAWYAVACISFDGVVALYLAHRCSRRRFVSSRLRHSGLRH